MAEDYAQLAVNSIAGMVLADYPAQLRAIEVEQSMAVGSLSDPIDVLNYFAPDDVRAPLVQVYETKAQQRNANTGLWVFDIAVNIQYTSDVNLTSAADTLRRYLTAMIRLIRDNPTVSDTLAMCYITDYRSLVIQGRQKSAIRHIYSMGLSASMLRPGSC